MRKRFTALLVALAVVLSLGLASSTATAAPPSTGLSVPITGTFTDAVGGSGTFAGTFTVTRFIGTDSGDLLARGTLEGTLTDSLGSVVGVTQVITIPVTSASGSCEILHLELGPLDLDLLGLQVHLDRVVLDITAEAGSGNLLGNLLCAIAHLLDDGNPLGDLAGLLNKILRLLG